MNRLHKLKSLFSVYNIDGYIIPKNDEFFGEYIDKGNDRLNYITQFTGSAGYGLILKEKSYIFVDGRYTIQAKKEVNKAFKVIEIHKKKPLKVLEKFKKKLVIGFDPKIFTDANLLNNFKAKNVVLLSIQKNLVDKIWLKKPKVKIKKFFLLNSKNTGKNYKKKINLVCKILRRKKVDKMLITAPENIAWILNIRGKDSKFSPMPNCHAIIDNKKKVTLVVNRYKINVKFKSYFKKFLNYVSPSRVVDYFNDIENNKVFLIDKLSCSYFYKKEIEKRFLFKEEIDPIYLLKAKKNKVEINNSIKSHIFDGVALTKFIYWLKNNVANQKITEIIAQEKLEKFRKKNPNYQFPSFSTISGAGPNGAIVHYRANKKTARLIKKSDIYLCDSGGQYHYGTTDVTRTLCFSKQPKNIKNIFTKVLKGHIGIATYNLKKNTTGNQLDKVARYPLKRSGLDYDHGTGHGVGYFSNVHEGPQAISKYNKIKIDTGMILSNEPGYYKTNYFGIRIENLIYAKKIKKGIKFENLTLVPIEKDLINFKLLHKKEKEYLNEYHKKIYSILSKYLKKGEKNWLKNFIN